MSSENVTFMSGVEGGPTAVRNCLAHRGYSDSIVSSCQQSNSSSSSSSTHDINTISATGFYDSTSSKLIPPCTCGQSTPSTSQCHTVSQRVNFGHNLQLPSFKSLGISNTAFAGQPPGRAALSIGALPTPPEDPLAEHDSNIPLPLGGGGFSRSISFTEGIIPTTPASHDFASFFPSKVSEQAAASDMPDGPHAAGAPRANPEPPSTKAQENSTTANQQSSDLGALVVEDPSGGGGDSETSSSEDNGFIIGAIPFTNHTVTSSDLPVLHAMCYTQPCPLEGVETAFNEVLIDMESQATQMGKYIEVTYQMPPKFNMNQIPTSPAATPNANQAASDYFSAHVYTRGIVAQTYESAMSQSGPSSPRPAVAPGSINVAMLERYIPPPTLDEYTNLFSTDMPSALVDRLFELSPSNGTFIFIYPTAAGAKTFFSNYLRPLLDPLLRTIASTHGHSADLPAAVGALASLNGDLLTFDRTVTRLTTLLRKLSRPTSSTPHPHATPMSTPTNNRTTTTRTYALIHSDCSVVDVSKQAVVNWWLEQEKGRIRKAVEQYFHSRRADSTVGMTAKIEEGLRKREYNDYDPDRSGIEVGLFVIRRTS